MWSFLRPHKSGCSLNSSFSFETFCSKTGSETYSQMRVRNSGGSRNSGDCCCGEHFARLPSLRSAAMVMYLPHSDSMSAVDAAIAGRPKPTASDPGYSGAETPRVNGYAFVDAEPTPEELGVPVSDETADAAERGAGCRAR